MSVNYIPHQHDLELANRTIAEQAEEIARLKVELTKVTAERDELKLTRMGDHRGCTDEDCQCSTCVNDHYYCCDVSNHNKSCVLNNCPDYEQEVTNAN
jgi:hypothetical protein